MFLIISNLAKIYYTGIITHVLKGVDLEMERGQIGVILGPSGSGKSTLMNLLIQKIKIRCQPHIK